MRWTNEKHGSDDSDDDQEVVHFQMPGLSVRITRWEPNHAMGVEHIGLVTGSGVFTLTALDESTTRFEWTEKLTFPWWLGGPIGAFVGGKVVLRSIWRGNLRRLAALCERAN